MSFLIPEPDIDLYKTGFPQDDILHRKPEGARLSRLLEEIDQPMVVALDGGWGSGKTVFLKYWVGEHSQNRPDTKCVYFDAFANDFRDQPLTGLVAELASRFATEDTIGAKAVHLLRKHAGKIALTTLRIGLAAATAGLSEGAIAGAGDAMDAAADEATKQSGDALGDAAEAYLAAEDAQVAAMAGFRNQILALTKPDDQDQPTKRLIFVVDELDRCRPDYALSVLETIKHFFAIPGVHFVLGTNIEALSASVNARYGLEDRSRAYLTKFVDVTLHLPDASDDLDDKTRVEVSYFLDCARKAGLSEMFGQELKNHLEHLSADYRLSLRETRVLTRLAILHDATVATRHPRYLIVLAGVLILKVTDPTVYDQFRNNTGALDPVSRRLGGPEYNEKVREAWMEFTGELEDDPAFKKGAEQTRQRLLSDLKAFSLSGDTP